MRHHKTRAGLCFAQVGFVVSGADSNNRRKSDEGNNPKCLLSIAALMVSSRFVYGNEK